MGEGEREDVYSDSDPDSEVAITCTGKWFEVNEEEGK